MNSVEQKKRKKKQKIINNLINRSLLSCCCYKMEEKKNSPFDSFLIDDPTPNNPNRLTITSEESPTICITCQQDLRVKSSKILSCLHSICLTCLEKTKDSSGRTEFLH